MSKRCLICNKKIKELKKRQTPNYCSDECAYKEISNEIPMRTSSFNCCIRHNKTARRLYPSLVDDENSDGYRANAMMALEDL